MTVNTGKQSIAADVKFPSVDEERILYVLLQDRCLVLPGALVSYDVLYLLEIS
jgi:hypothetical protein